jgi:hypothetical protein
MVGKTLNDVGKEQFCFLNEMKGINKNIMGAPNVNI